MQKVRETRLLGIPIRTEFAAARKSLPASLSETTRRDPNESEAFRDTELTADKVKVVRKDPTVKYCSRILHGSVTRVDKRAVGDDPDQVVFLQNHLLETGVLADYMKKATTARDFGYFVGEVRYELRGGVVALRTVKGLDPENCVIQEDDAGSLTGIKHLQPYGGEVVLLADDGKFILVTNRWWESNNNRYGLSELEEARPWAYAKRFIRSQMLRWTESKADPPTIGWYNENMELTDVATEDSADIKSATAVAMLARIRRIRQGGNAVFPMDSEGKEMVKVNQLTGTDRAPVFKTLFNICDIEIYHAMMTPEKAVSEGSGTGTYSQSEVHAEFLYQQAEDLATEELRPWNQYIIPKLLAWNFPTVDPTVKIVHAGLRAADKALIQAGVDFALGLAENGVKLTPEFAGWFKEKTGVPIDTRFVGSPPQAGAPSRFAKPDPKRVDLVMVPALNRALTERELLLPGGGERYLLSLARDMGAVETDGLAQLVGLAAEEKERYLNAIEKAMGLSRKRERMKAIRELGLKMKGKFQRAIYDILRKSGDLGLERVARELKLSTVMPIGPDASAFVRTHAENVTNAVLDALLARLRGTALEGVTSELPPKQVAFRVGKVFGKFIDKEIAGKVIKEASTSYNMARAQVEQLPLDDPIVSATRTSVLEPTTCAICEHLDQLTIDVNDPHFPEFRPPSQCLGGAACHCQMFYNQQSMRPGLREVNFKPVPASLDIWSVQW